MNKLTNRIYLYVCSILFLLIISFLCYISYTKTCYITIQLASEHTFFLKDNLLLNIVITVCFVLAICAFSKMSFVKKMVYKINNDDKSFIIIKTFLLILLFVFGFIWVYTTQINPEGDQHLLTLAVRGFKYGDYSAFESGGYIETWPNQAGIFLIYYLFSFVFGDNLYLGLQLINVLSVVFVYKSLSDIAGELKYSNFVRLLIILSAFIFPVLIVYCWLIYGNMLGMAFILLSIKYELKYFENYKVGNLLCSSLFLMIALMAKSFALIYMIGMLIYALFKIIDTKRIKSTLFIVSIIVAFLFQMYIPKMYIQFKTGLDFNQGASSFAHIAMGMQEGERCEGWHNKYNYDTYHEVGNNTEVQSELAKKEIDNRLLIFKNDKDYTLKFFSRKIISQWNNPTFEMFYGMDIDYGYGFQYRFGDDYISKYIEPFLNLYFETRIQNVLNIEQSLIVFGCLLYIISFSLKKDKNMEEMLLPLCFIGGFLFLIIWEAKAQYALFYYVILFLYAILGYRELIVNFNKKNIYAHKKELIISITVCVLLVFCNNALFNKDYLSNDDGTYKEYVECGNTYDWFIDE